MKINSKKTFITLIFILIALVLIYVLTVVYTFKRDGLFIRTKSEPAASLTPQAVPCEGKPASKVEIARPVERPSEFTATGGDVFIAIKKIGSTAVLEFAPSATILIGFVDQYPQWNVPQDVADKTIIKLQVNEGVYNKVSLKPGRYWLWVDHGINLELLSCSPKGLSDPLPR